MLWNWPPNPIFNRLTLRDPQNIPVNTLPRLGSGLPNFSNWHPATVKILLSRNTGKAILGWLCQYSEINLCTSISFQNLSAF